MQSEAGIGFFGFIGRSVIEFYNYILDITTMVFVALKSFITLDREKRKVANKVMYRKIYLTVRNTLGIVGIVSFIFGALVVTQIASFNMRMDFIGKIFDVVIVKELGPLFTALIIIGRSATFITTELGTMQKTQELTAFKVMGIEPEDYVMMPRVIGVTFSLIVLALFFDVCCITGGLVMASLIGNISVSFYLQSIAMHVSYYEILGTILKAIVSGLILTSISCYHGFAITGSFVEIPQQVARSFVSSLFFCFLCNFIISYFLYL